MTQHFLDATKAQLTYHGLFQLAATLEPGSLVALFRNAHLSVVYKSPPESAHQEQKATEASSALYALVTDDVFLHEPSIVWERFDDIDGGSTFVDSDFRPAVPMGGDVAGHTVDTLRDAEDAAECVSPPFSWVRGLTRTVWSWRGSYRQRKTSARVPRISNSSSNAAQKRRRRGSRARMRNAGGGD